LWRLQCKAGETLTAELINDVTDGWLELSLYDANWSSRGSSSSGGGFTTRNYTPTSDGPVFLEVTGPLIRYQLKITTETGTATQAFAPPRCERLGPGIFPARPLDKEVFYAIECRIGQTVMVEASFDNAAGDIDMELVDRNGAPIASASTVDDVEHIEFASHVAGPLYLRLYTFHDEPTEFELTVAVNQRTIPLGPGHQVGPPEAVTVAEHPGHWVRGVELEAGETLTATITFDDGQGDLDLAVHDPRGREVRVSATKGGDETVGYTAAKKETVYLRVFGAENLPFAVEMTASQ
jgi:hypothetical protein